MTLYNEEGYSWGEALGKAQELLGVLWTVAEDPKVVLPEAAPEPKHPPGPPAQKRAAPAVNSKPEICKSWNTPQGCTQKQRDCPHGAEHKCSFMVNGAPCLKWNHNAVTHARWVAEERRSTPHNVHKRSRKGFR